VESQADINHSLDDDRKRGKDYYRAEHVPGDNVKLVRQEQTVDLLWPGRHSRSPMHLLSRYLSLAVVRSSHLCWISGSLLLETIAVREYVILDAWSCGDA
jgi:hypothetical protein